MWVDGVHLGQILSPGGTACREAEKEKGLLEKRLQRLEDARAAESAQAGAQLQKQRDAVAAELSAKDNKINDLVEELGATQALLTEKEHALQEVTGIPELSHPYHATIWQEGAAHLHGVTGCCEKRDPHQAATRPHWCRLRREQPGGV